MESTDVYVTNLEDYTSQLNDLADKLDGIIGNIEDIQTYLRVIVWCIFFVSACYVTNWLWKTYIRGLIRSYFKLPL